MKYKQFCVEQIDKIENLINSLKATSKFFTTTTDISLENYIGRLQHEVTILKDRINLEYEQ